MHLLRTVASAAALALVAAPLILGAPLEATAAGTPITIPGKSILDPAQAQEGNVETTVVGSIKDGMHALQPIGSSWSDEYGPLRFRPWKGGDDDKGFGYDELIRQSSKLKNILDFFGAWDYETNGPVEEWRPKKQGWFGKAVDRVAGWFGRHKGEKKQAALLRRSELLGKSIPFLPDLLDEYIQAFLGPFLNLPRCAKFSLASPLLVGDYYALFVDTSRCKKKHALKTKERLKAFGAVSEDDAVEGASFGIAFDGEKSVSLSSPGLARREVERDVIRRLWALLKGLPACADHWYISSKERFGVEVDFSGCDSDIVLQWFESNGLELDDDERTIFAFSLGLAHPEEEEKDIVGRLLDTIDAPECAHLGFSLSLQHFEVHANFSECKDETLRQWLESKGLVDDDDDDEKAISLSPLGLARRDQVPANDVDSDDEDEQFRCPVAFRDPSLPKCACVGFTKKKWWDPFGLFHKPKRLVDWSRCEKYFKERDQNRQRYSSRAEAYDLDGLAVLPDWVAKNDPRLPKCAEVKLGRRSGRWQPEPPTRRFVANLTSCYGILDKTGPDNKVIHFGSPPEFAPFCARLRPVYIKGMGPEADYSNCRGDGVSDFLDQIRLIDAGTGLFIPFAAQLDYLPKCARLSFSAFESRPGYFADYTGCAGSQADRRRIMPRDFNAELDLVDGGARLTRRGGVDKYTDPDYDPFPSFAGKIKSWWNYIWSHGTYKICVALTKESDQKCKEWGTDQGNLNEPERKFKGGWKHSYSSSTTFWPTLDETFDEWLDGG